MRKKELLIILVGFKVIIILFCISLAYVPWIVSQSYFQSGLTASEYQEAVSEAQNMDARNEQGVTGLMDGAKKGNMPLVEALLNNGAHLNLQSTNERQTALLIAVKSMTNPECKIIANYLIDAYANTTIRDKDNNTALSYVTSASSTKDRLAVTEALVKNGADINAKYAHGNTLLHIAVGLQATDWMNTLVKTFGGLLDIHLKNDAGENIVAYAERLGLGDFIADVKKVEQAAVPKASEYGPVGLTGLMIAIMKGDKALIKTMIQDRAALNQVANDIYGNSPLHIALLFEDVDTIKKLVQSNANVLLLNKKGEVPASFLVRMLNEKIKIQAADILLSKNPNAILFQNSYKENLLHLVVRYDDQALLDFLLKRYKPLLQKAILVKNGQYQTPYQLAQKLRRTSIKEQLEPLLKIGF